MGNSPELHMFILWEKARPKESEILKDISTNFEIVGKFAITWSKDHVSSNFTRFYGVNLPAYSHKEKECGTGEFLLIVVKDPSPKYEIRLTSKGYKRVNANIFDKKSKYREWTGGGHKIHGTNNTAEFNHDLTLILGCNREDFINKYGLNGDKVVSLNRDVEGADGWHNLEHLFYVLNNTCNYVILRGKNELLNDAFSDEHRDIDILTPDCEDMRHIINGESCCNPYRPHEVIVVEGKIYYLDLWDFKSDYFDPRWSKKMLEDRVKTGFYYFLDPYNDFNCLLYHCLIFKGFIADDYKRAISEYVSGLSDGRQYEEILLDFLKSNDYQISRPKDKSIKLHIPDSLKDYVKDNGYIIKYSDGLCANGDTYYSIVLEKENSFVKIGSHMLMDNEAYFLKQLEGAELFPHLIRHESYPEHSLIEISRVPGMSYFWFLKSYKHRLPSYIRSFIRETLKTLVILSGKGIIHRDFIPQNIFIHENGGKPKVSLIDFGWAMAYGTKDSVPLPDGLGKHYYSNNYSDFISLGNILTESFGEIPYISRIAKELYKIGYDDYNDSAKISSVVATVNGILKKYHPKDDMIYGLKILHRYSMVRWPRLANAKIKARRLLGK